MSNFALNSIKPTKMNKESNPEKENFDNPFAFPDPCPENYDAGAGMTLRDYFAAKIIQSYMINCKAIQVNDGYIANTEYEKLAKYSYEIADAMLKERSK